MLEQYVRSSHSLPSWNAMYLLFPDATLPIRAVIPGARDCEAGRPGAEA